MRNRQIVLAARPEGLPKESDFRLTEIELPPAGEGQFLVRTNYLSVDPYMRGRMSEAKSYAEPVGLGEVMVGGTVGTVIESRHKRFRPGDVLVGNWGWQEYAVLEGPGVAHFDTTIAPMSTALGVLGMPGMTAYFGLLEIGQPAAGETVFVSGGGRGGRIAGGADRQGHGVPGGGLCRFTGKGRVARRGTRIRRRLQLQRAARLHGETRGSMSPRDRRLLRQRGGALTDAVFTQLNLRVRVVVCGQIDQYNATRPPRGPRLLWHLIVKRVRVEGFLVFDFAARFAEGQRAMAQWLREGKVKYRETIVDGLENAPKAFVGLFHGENVGKQLVRVAEPLA